MSNTAAEVSPGRRQKGDRGRGCCGLQTDVVGQAQHGFGLNPSQQLWCRTSAADQRTPLVVKMKNQEDVARSAKARPQVTRSMDEMYQMECIGKKKLSWGEIQGMEASRIKLL